MADSLHIEPGRAVKKRTRVSTTLILFGVLAAMVVGFSAMSRDFYSFQNISTMLTNISFSGIVAGTLTLVMITGGLDISIGGNIALTSCLVAFLFNLPHPVPAWALIPIALGLGAVIGAFNGFFITRLDLNPIITTLGTMAVTRGLAYVLTKARSILIMEDVTGFIGRTVVPGIKIPIPLIFFAVIFTILFFLLSRSKF
jgi:ribose transport system permease protein